MTETRPCAYRNCPVLVASGKRACPLHAHALRSYLLMFES